MTQKKKAHLLVVVLLAVLALLAPMTPSMASALPTSPRPGNPEAREPWPPGQQGAQYETGAVCEEYGTWPTKIRSCIKMAWYTQQDRSGINMWSTDFRTTLGCNSLEDEQRGTRRYGDAEARWETPEGKKFKYWDIGFHGCDPAFFLHGIGADKGSMVYKFRTKARINFDSDEYVCWIFVLRPGGVWKGWSDHGSGACPYLWEQQRVRYPRAARG